MDAKGDAKPENLPPIDSAAISLSLRVRQYTITWETLAATTPNPFHWGWKEENGKHQNRWMKMSLHLIF